MIICPICCSELIFTTSEFSCPICKYTAQLESNIVNFHRNVICNHEDYNSELLESLYQFEKNHFWFQHRKKIIIKAFLKFIKSSHKIIEIGAGTGNIAQMLLENGYKNIAVGEMHLNGLQYAKKYGLSELYQFDLLQAPFKEHFEVVCMFDVIEHIENDRLAIENAHKMLSQGGKLVLTVPAHKWLWSNIDVNSGHKRRYNYTQIKSLLEMNNFKIIHFQSFFILTLPLILIRAFTNKKNKKLNVNSLKSNSGLVINPQINNFLKLICKIESKIFANISLKFGGSLLIVAVRNPINLK